MSNHTVVVRKVVDVIKHPNADKLEIVKLDGLKHTIISAKDNFNKNDYALFIPDSCILPKEMIDYFELSFLKNGEVKTTKIRGIYSQALILPLKEVKKYSIIFKEEWEKDINTTMIGKTVFDIDYSETLGITRKVEDINSTGQAKGSLPIGVEKYDLENAERYPEFLEQIAKVPFMITEKLEGTNFAVHATKDGIQYCSRSLVKSGGIYEEIPIREGINLFANYLLDKFNCSWVTIRGEIIGSKIQGNIYNLKEKQCYVFDIMIDGNYLSGMKTVELCEKFDVKHVPVLIENGNDFNLLFPDIEDLKNFSNGKSLLNPEVDREGIVIRSYNNPRIIFKQRSPEYLSKG